MRPTTPRIGLLTTVLLCCVAGCEGDPRREVVPVNGRVLIGGVPAGRAHIVFHPVDPYIASRSVAVARDDGSFRLMTYAIDDGAPPGDYIVTVFWRDESIPYDECAGDDLVKHDRLCGLYLDARTSPLRATVHAKDNELTIRAADLSGLFKVKTPARSPAGGTQVD